jgi:hypothetical protein
METLKLGMILSIIPFSAIFLFLTIAWALVDISVRKLTGSRRAIWSVVVVVLPLVGAILYNFKVRLPEIELASCKAHPVS